jgi:SAM-dependent methyltransferase
VTTPLDCETTVRTEGGEHKRIYRNAGNLALLRLMEGLPKRVLDVGCGAGDNARIIRAAHPGCEIVGITHSAAEALVARQWMTDCLVFDIEGALPPGLAAGAFDVIIFSHVLEHVREPASVLGKFAGLLGLGGSVLVAVPNTLSWAMRLQFLRGDFAYRSDGVLDDTHLRFFTYVTADDYLLGKTPALRLASKTVTGSVPLWLLRRHLFPRRWSVRIDELGCRLWPNLFGEQVLIKAVLEG